MPARPSSRHGLRVTVRLHDTVVEQRVHWQPRFGLGRTFAVGASVPTESGKRLAVGRWRAGGRLKLRVGESPAEDVDLKVGDVWRWENGAGVNVDLDMIPLKHAQRTSKEAWGDVALLVLMLTLMVGVGQVNFLLRQLTGAVPAENMAYEPTPEFIARLLQRDFEGESQGRPLRADRPDAPNSNPSFYLPAGHEGAWETTGGSNVGDEVIRGEDPGESLADALRHAPPTDARDEVEAIAEAPTPVPDGAPIPAIPEVEISLEEEVEKISLAKPIERFIGWGFRDWFNVADSRTAQEERISRILEHTRVRLKIDPDDPQAIQTAAYYAYLSENHELGTALYDRFIDLYPKEPSGYNNLGLIHKRLGEYTEEEALYRKALELDPLDHHVINNLAVNLAHQGRFEEALRLMATLEELTPDDAYADLHRAKIYAAMGKKGPSFRYLKKALAAVDSVDTLHHIEFRQDIRLDPAFDRLRSKPRFRKILERKYGDDAAALIGTPKRSALPGLGVVDG